MSEAEGHAQDAVTVSLRDHNDAIKKLVEANHSMLDRIERLEREVLPREPEEDA